MLLLDKKSESVFYELLRAGLWERDIQFNAYGIIDYSEIYRIAEEQSVVGLVAAGIEHICDVKIPKRDVLSFMGTVLSIEARNKAMNEFLATLIRKLRSSGVHVVVVKGQGIAQCYKRPLWRESGDIDLFISEDSFVKARELVRPCVTGFDPKNDDARNISTSMDGWAIELHGNQFIGLSKRIDKGIQEIQDDIFSNGQERKWLNNDTVIYLPSADNDVIIIFTHFIKHFYKGGLGLRQICDWCRLLWTYNGIINNDLLKRRLVEMRLVTEWKAFGAFAVRYLGMPREAMPLYSPTKKWENKARYINTFVLEVGNMGNNRNHFFNKKIFIVRKLYSFSRRLSDLCRHARVFPIDSFRFLGAITTNGLRAFANRKNYNDYWR